MMKPQTNGHSETAKGRNTNRLLNISAKTWFVTAVIGQWIFAIYVATFFIPILFQNGMEGLKDTHLPSGFVSGQMFGNLAIASHIILAIAILVGGPLQLIPQIRSKFPAFHRLNGRIYLTLVFITSLAGLYVVWTRGVVGGPVGHIAISLDAVLIMAFAILTLRFALKRQIAHHNRWALRLFMVVSAVWFFRIGLMLWMILTGGIGLDFETFTGPALTFLYFGQMFIPLAFLELYFWAKSRAGKTGKLLTAITIFALAPVTAMGTLAATFGMWFTRLL